MENTKKILLLLVGGTICTEENEKGTLSVSEKAGLVLKDNYEQSDSEFAKTVQIIPTENLFILSEDMTPAKWNLMVNTCQKYMKADSYIGVIIAHGTDTLAYSAALLSILFNTTDIPIFLVSSNKNLNSPKANGNANFRCAVECICRNIKPNVYVTYKNLSDEKMYIHLASHLTQCPIYSEDFSSAGAVEVENWSEEAYTDAFKKIDTLYPYIKYPTAIDMEKPFKITDCVLYISPYVGLNYNAFKYEFFKAVLHGTYHSGTACADCNSRETIYGRNSILEMIDSCARYKVDTYLSPSLSPLDNKTKTYDTVRVIAEHSCDGNRICYLYGMTNEMAYVKLLIAYSVFTDKNDIATFINTEFNHEFVSSKSSENSDS